MPKLPDAFGILFATATLIMYGLLDAEQKAHKQTAFERDLAQNSVTALTGAIRSHEEKNAELEKRTIELRQLLEKNGCDQDSDFWFKKHNECRIELLGLQEEEHGN